ncbi:MAG: winged helix-turn-helix transcriptional regulator [Fusobacteriaceae bacterium]|nr:winged helix-turn-helix transcriptional regulator [Fusobacteriaceae bacterium]
MNFEKDIFVYFHSIMKKMKKIADNELIYEKLTHTEMRILMTIYYMDIKTQEDIVANLDIDRSNISRSLKKLENLGYVCKQKNLNDKRINDVLLTQKGIDIKEKLLLIRTNMKKTFDFLVAKNEMDILIKLLEKADESINEENYLRVKNIL